MYDYTELIHYNSRDTLKRLTTEQKERDIRAINNLLSKHGLIVTSGIESFTTIQYRVKLSPDSNLSKLLKLQPNLCIALDDDTVRLYREKSELVIEKKGADNTIWMGTLYTEQFDDHKGLPIMLGIDAQGNRVITDLKKMPHALFAGATGSGKSVLESVFICSLLIKYPNMIIYGIDTKRVEFQSFRYAPNFHLVTDAAAATQTLRDLCDEMEDRYNQLVRAKVNNIDEYNNKGGKMNPIVVIIDEFADLMLLSGKHVEEYVVRLAQKARACGIHLIIATQRPTKEVVTGLIKANIPTRICLKVTSALDSRIILDRNGGETLVGKGDMLFLGNGAFEPIRIQGCYLEEVEKSNVAITARKRVEESKEKTTSPFSNLFKK